MTPSQEKVLTEREKEVLSSFRERFPHKIAGVIDAGYDFPEAIQTAKEEERDLMRKEAEQATSEMRRVMREDNLDINEAYECYGYIRGVRDLIYALNLQKNRESKTHNDLQMALTYLRVLTNK